jgi:response regulator RpfG family c-di-GMP phosphodiesterase
MACFLNIQGMMPKGMLIFVDDDPDEYEMFKDVFNTFYDNEVKYVKNGEEGLKLITEHKDHIFMIVSDINMPKMNGLEMKRIIEGTPLLKIRSIPFVFRTVHDNAVVTKEAYGLGIQGLFIKSADIEVVHKQIDMIINYWTLAVHPNTLD